MGAAEDLNLIANDAEDAVSRSLNEFYLELKPENREPFISLKLHLIRPDSIPSVSFFVKRGKRYRVFRDQREPFNAFEIQNLLDAGIDRIFLSRADGPIVRQYLETFLIKNEPAAQQVSVESQVGQMRAATVRLTEELFQDPSPENIRKGMKAVTGFVNLLVRDPKAFYHLIRLSSHDHYTYQHSVGVGLNAIALGKRLR